MDVQNPIGFGLQTAVTPLSQADILALGTTPKILIPAPGAHLNIAVLGFAIISLPGSVAYDNSLGDQLDLVMSGRTEDLVVPTQLTGIVTNANSQNVVCPAQTTDTYTTSVTANKAVTLAAANSYNQGKVLTASIGAPGTGYVVNDTGHINAGNSLATYKVTSVGAGGAVTGFTITAGGLSYPTGTWSTVDSGAQPGVGVNFTITVLTIQTGNGTLLTYTYYTITPAP